MRILIAAPRGVTGPMPRLAELLAGGLRGNGCEVELSRWGGTGSSPAARVRESVRNVAAIRRRLRSEPFDVVLVQTSHEGISLVRDLALALAVRRLPGKVVLQYHGGHADRLARPGSPAFKLATRALLRLTDGVFLLSSEERDALRRFEPRGRFHLVSNPFVPFDDPPPDEGVEGAAGTSEPVVLFVARVVADKGVFDALAGFAIARERVPCRLVVAGDGPAAADLRRAVEERGLSEHVTLAGYLPRERLHELYRQAAVFILPTYHAEGFPTSISEAMSAGLPVVTTRVRGNADHLQEETNALFVPPHDPRRVAEALERVLTDEQLRRTMSNANREKIEDFAPDRVAADYVRALESILPGRDG